MNERICQLGSIQENPACNLQDEGALGSGNIFYWNKCVNLHGIISKLIPKDTIISSIVRKMFQDAVSERLQQKLSRWIANYISVSSSGV
jgi:hypothetical protein